MPMPQLHQEKVLLTGCWAGKMDTPSMGAFLRLVSERHPEEFIVLVIDGAPSHRAEHLQVPKNMALVRLPAIFTRIKSGETSL